MQTTPTTYEKTTRYDAESRDYAWFVNGELIGFARTPELARQAANTYVLSLIEDDRQAADAATAELVAQERAAGVAEAQPLPPVGDEGSDEFTPPMPQPAPTPQVRRYLPATAKEIARAVYVARQELTDDRAIRAVNRAYEELLHGMWIFDGERLVVPSRTTRGERYTASADGCECAAHAHGRICWHMMAFIVVTTASAQATPEAIQTPAERLAAQDAIYAALQSPGPAETSDLSPAEAREILASRPLVAHA